MYREPTSHIVDPSTGGMTSATGRYEKRLKDLEGIYLDENCFRSAASSRGDEIVYSVNEVRPTEATGDLIFGTTHMEPGRIGDEFYMTRGHIHAVANRPEVYYGESGAGVMLMESLDGETRVLEVTPGAAVYVPPMLMIDVALDASETARWMLHCHHMPHLSTGMMTEFAVSA